MHLIKSGADVVLGAPLIGTERNGDRITRHRPVHGNGGGGMRWKERSAFAAA
jgi:hypothetical protein